MPSRFLASLALSLTGTVLLASSALGQTPAAGPPAVGVFVAAKRPVTQIQEFVGRIVAVDRVALVARVSAQLEEAPFREGSEVKKGDVLFKLERAPFEAQVENGKATIAQYEALLRNATLVTQRAASLLKTPAGQQSTVDSALAQQQAYAAQLLGAQAQLKTAQISLDYTAIAAPVDGKIGRNAVSVGNIVGPNSGTLATIVSQDPMYVSFPVPARQLLEIGARYAGKGGFSAVVLRVRLPDGTMYPLAGKLDFVDPTVATSTDTIILRGTIPNPLRAEAKPGDLNPRQLVDGEFVTVLLEGVEPVVALGIPRSAVLSDQQGNYVYVVGTDETVQQKRIQLGQSTPATAMIAGGLDEGARVVVDGIQRVRPGLKVAASPAVPGPVDANTGGQ